MKALLLIFVALSLVIPSAAFAQPQIAALSPTQTPQPTLTLQMAQCVDFNSDKICEFVVLANGTMIANPAVQVQPVNPMTQLVERQKIIIQQEKAKNNDNDDDDKKQGDDCWENGRFVGKDECDTHGLPICSEVNFRVACFDELDSPQPANDDSPRNDEDDDDNDEGDENTSNCGGEPCTDTEKEDSWTDLDEEESGEGGEGEQEEIVIENLNNEAEEGE